jgi:hypothetical protein
MVVSRVETRGYCGIDLFCQLTSSYIHEHVDDGGKMGYSTYDDGTGSILTYGICVTDDDGNTVADFADVSTDREKVESIIAILDHGVSTLHIADVLEDCLV